MWAMQTPYKLQLQLDQFCLVTTLGALHFFKKNPPTEMSGYGPASYINIYVYMHTQQ